MIIAIVGKLGQGKTLLLTALAQTCHDYGSLFVQKLLLPKIISLKNSQKIYSNYWLAFDFSPVTNDSEIEAMQEGNVFLDELWIWCDSRMSASLKNKVLSGIAMKSRKRNLNYFYTTQTFGKVDKRIRNITDYVLIPDFDMCSCILKVEVYEPIDRFQKPLKSFSFNAKQYFDMYDTTQEIESLNNEGSEKELEKDIVGGVRAQQRAVTETKHEKNIKLLSKRKTSDSVNKI